MGVCIITDDVIKLSRFYQKVICTVATGDDIHSEIKMNGIGLAIYKKAAAQKDMGFDFSKYDGNGKTVLMIKVEDVDHEYTRLQKIVTEFMTSPKTYPWGARSFQFRDPDGNIVDFVTPTK